MRALLAATALALALPVQAQDLPAFRFSDAARADYPGEIALGTGPGQPQEEWFRQDGALQVRNISAATLTPFLPDPRAATGAAVIVAPGGGFLGLAIEDEGLRVARWLSDHGIAAFVLKYRVLPTPADPATFRRELIAVRTGKGQASFRPPADTPADSLADGQAALRHVLAHARDYGIDPRRTGMMGFSAGAFLTLSVATADAPDARPAFIAPIYGRQAAVTPPVKAPPMFALIAGDDPLFGREGFALVESWRRSGAPVELHLLQNGGHGFGLGRAGTSSSDWIFSFHRWLDVNGMLDGTP
jgi:acetyl esterase/lipase